MKTVREQLVLYNTSSQMLFVRDIVKMYFKMLAVFREGTFTLFELGETYHHLVMFVNATVRLNRNTYCRHARNSTVQLQLPTALNIAPDRKYRSSYHNRPVSARRDSCFPSFLFFLSFLARKKCSR